MDVDKFFWEDMMANPGRVALLARLPPGEWVTDLIPDSNGEVGLFIHFSGPKVNGFNVERRGV